MTPATWRGRDHPRACRGQRAATHRHSAPPGPSPRVRGAAGLPSFFHLLPGTIPARAGSSGPPAARGPPCRDHPRACGEQAICALPGLIKLGPSPRVRGAGGGPGAESRESWDHPRACGGQLLIEVRGVFLEGPSPRVRGPADAVRQRDDRLGTIPARAGSRSAWRRRSRRFGDHPRACGEQRVSYRPMPNRAGPSPRVRGAAAAAVRLVRASGTIPARAGSRPGRSSRA